MNYLPNFSVEITPQASADEPRATNGLDYLPRRHRTPGDGHGLNLFRNKVELQQGQVFALIGSHEPADILPIILGQAEEFLRLGDKGAVLFPIDGEIDLVLQAGSCDMIIRQHQPIFLVNQRSCSSADPTWMGR